MQAETMQDEELAQALEAVLRAAARFFDISARAHREARPEDSDAFAKLAVSAGAKPGICIGLFPDPQLQVGYIYADAWHPFFSWSGTGPDVGIPH